MVDGPDHLHFFLRDVHLDDRRRGLEPLDIEENVLLDGVLEGISRLALGILDGGGDRLDQGGKMARQGGAVADRFDGGVDRTA